MGLCCIIKYRTSNSLLVVKVVFTNSSNSDSLYNPSIIYRIIVPLYYPSEELLVNVAVLIFYNHLMFCNKNKYDLVLTKTMKLYIVQILFSLRFSQVKHTDTGDSFHICHTNIT